MSNSYADIADPLMLGQEVGPSKARFSGKALVLASLLVGLGLAALCISGGGATVAQKAITTMALPMMQTVKGSQMQPMSALAMHGIQTGPMANLAIAAIEATNRGHGMRDVAAKAAKMDSKTRSKLVAMASSTKLKVEDMAGVTAPLGFFDPLGFTAQLSEGKLLFYREVELKHGRIGMLAALGFLVGENFHPLFGGNIDTPAYRAFQETPLETFWPAVVAAIAIPELFSVFTFNEPAWKQTSDTEFWSIKSTHTPGDLGFDPLGLKPSDPAEFKELQTKELNNGRLAMIAAAGMIAQELVTGEKLFPGPWNLR